ncbi:flagellar hook-basal body complex protein FliE [Roseomonas frigidaquae]|uniref:Flagellar hook-basal body complex protein FliE n=1 Tax=Falsiroseomonas frigidaquae TaxID=487318 RepID=A0ABX1ERT3_9PROT|nr:flagellar hook-basal body complex protein FliE [Falsiroseomonas frigidaquae]NKE43292.1 flagellar hook-basal body complex protein FliE [Falsiroseomonas frigidaquae]
MSTPLGFNPALQAYRATAGSGAGTGALIGEPVRDARIGQAFDAALGDAMRGAIESGRTADATSQAAMAGQVGTSEVVMAVARAELALQTAVAVRDRMVSAYQEVMRMSV